MCYLWSCARMRSSFMLFFMIVLAFAFSAHAETAKVGGSSVEYSIPKGYVAASGLAYDPAYEYIKAAMAGYTVHALYAPESVDRAMQASNGDGLTQYMIVMHTNQLENRSFSTEEFEGLKQVLGGAPSGDVEKALGERMRQVFEKHGLGDDFSIITTPLGIIEESKTHVSTLTLVKQRLGQGEDSVDITQAVVTRSVLGGGKILQASLYKNVEDEAEATLFQAEALAVFGSMNFKEGGAQGSSSSALNAGLRLLGYGGAVIFCVLMILWLRRRKQHL